MENNKQEWKSLLAWCVYGLLAPIWLPLSVYQTIRDEIVAYRYLKRRNLL